MVAFGAGVIVGVIAVIVASVVAIVADDRQL